MVRDAHGALARMLLLDQFTRNIFRDTPRAFAGDERALATAEEAVDARLRPRRSTVHERWFLYLPFEHAERRRGAASLARALRRARARDGRRDALEWARKHADVVFRFGRYPHRNAILGRASTPETRS